MIPRSLRADPRRIAAARPQVIRLPWVIARYVQEPGPGALAVVVSKKSAKLAVSRHLAKRRVAAAFLQVLPKGHAVSLTLTPLGAAARGETLRTWCAELAARILDTTHVH